MGDEKATALWRTSALLLALFVGSAVGFGSETPQEKTLPLPVVQQDSLRSVTYCVDPDWEPYERISQDQRHEGIAADLLALISTRSGVTFQLVPTQNWDESLAKAQDGSCQMLSFLNQTPKRDQWMVFTDPIFIDRNVIVTREGHSFIPSLASIRDEVMVLPKGTSIEERLRRDYPNLRIVTTDSERKAFEMVARRKADMTLRSLTVAVYTIKKEGWFNLTISGHLPEYDNALKIGIRKSATSDSLRQQLNAAIATVSLTEQERIANQHVAIHVRAGLDTVLLQKIVAAFLLILLTSLFWGLKLHKLNRQLLSQSLTDALTGLANRAALNIALGKAHHQSVQGRQALSVILCDLDFFKKVNDELGHLMGDRILKEFAAIATSIAPTGVTVGRWGGEEFLLVCAGFSPSDTQSLAERLCSAARSYAFSSQRPQTVSLGVAFHQPNENIDALLHRADEALYCAKGSGRDRVAIAS